MSSQMRLTCQRRKITLDVQAERESGSKKEMKTAAGCYDGRCDLELRGGKKNPQTMCWHDDVEVLSQH